MVTKTVPNTEIKVGDVVSAHGALFEIVSTEKVVHDGLIVARNAGKWLSGNIVKCYFGPGKNWMFQGNKYCMVDVVITE